MKQTLLLLSLFCIGFVKGQNQNCSDTARFRARNIFTYNKVSAEVDFRFRQIDSALTKLQKLHIQLIEDSIAIITCKIKIDARDQKTRYLNELSNVDDLTSQIAIWRKQRLDEKHVLDGQLDSLRAAADSVNWEMQLERSFIHQTGANLWHTLSGCSDSPYYGQVAYVYLYWRPHKMVVFKQRSTL